MQASFEKVSHSGDASFRCFARRAETFAFAWHYHPEYELTAILDNSGRRFVGDSIEDYQPGDLVLLGPNLPHTWESAPVPADNTAHEAIVIQFSHGFLGTDFFDHAEFEAVAALLSESAHGLSFANSSQHIAALRAMMETDGLDRLLALLDILGRLASHKEQHRLSLKEFTEPQGERDRSRIDRAFAFLEENYANDISQEKVAALVHLSPSGFSRFFRRGTGRGFSDCLNDIRTSHACRLLRETDLTITQICFSVGYRNISNFNRQFLRRHHISPRVYRNQHETRP